MCTHTLPSMYWPQARVLMYICAHIYEHVNLHRRYVVMASKGLQQNVDFIKTGDDEGTGARMSGEMPALIVPLTQ